MQNNRIVHITLKKCGSQWVRDVLSASQILEYSNKPFSGITGDITFINDLNPPDQTFSGPIYGMTHLEWKSWKKTNDQAIVVLRDPRDRLVSMMFSLLFSQGSRGYIDLGRKVINEFESLDEQLIYMMCQMSNSDVVKIYEGWSTR